MSQVDLSSLRMTPAAASPPRPPLGPRLLTLAIVLLAVAVATTFAWPLLRPVRTVPMARVRPAAGAATTAATTLAEAAGWIEPDPFPVFVRPLVAGRVESIEVLEGASVRAGTTVLARLAAAELQAAVERADALVAERSSELQQAEAGFGLVRTHRRQRAASRAAVADARMALEERQARLAAARGAEQRARADAAGAAAALRAQQHLATAGGSYAVALARAEAAATAAEATATAAVGELEAITREAMAAQVRLSLAEELFATPVDLDGAIATAEAARQKAAAALATAETERSIARRERQWTEVLAPVDGVVMRLFAAPGNRSGPDSEPLLALYDPLRLRARIDVPLGSIAGIHDGQAVELRSEVLGDVVVRGVVQRVQRESDLLKNTLQVKVQVLEPPPLLRPETLCRARFLGARTVDPAAPAAMAFVVPKAAVHDGMVFRFDPVARCARAVPVTIVQEGPDGVVVQGELAATQRVVLVPVIDGEAIQEQRP